VTQDRGEEMTPEEQNGLELFCAIHDDVRAIGCYQCWDLIIEELEIMRKRLHETHLLRHCQKLRGEK